MKMCSDEIKARQTVSEEAPSVITPLITFQTLLDDAEACRRKMTNATALIEGLSGERVRWTEASKGFESQTQRLVGDVLLATGFLSYSGPFNQEFRTLMIKNWKRELIQNKIPFSDVSLETTACSQNSVFPKVFHHALISNVSLILVGYQYYHYVGGQCYCGGLEYRGSAK